MFTPQLNHSVNVSDIEISLLYPFCGDVNTFSHAFAVPVATPNILILLSLWPPPIFSSRISQDSKYLAALSDVRLEGSNEAVYFVLRGLGMKASPGVAWPPGDPAMDMFGHLACQRNGPHRPPQGASALRSPGKKNIAGY